MAYDYDAALAIAQDHKCIPILDLIDWSLNYKWSSPSHPLKAFYAIAKPDLDGYEDFTLDPDCSFGYLELDLIAKALTCYVERPYDVVNFLTDLQDLERE